MPGTVGAVHDLRRRDRNSSARAWLLRRSDAWHSEVVPGTVSVSHHRIVIVRPPAFNTRDERHDSTCARLRRAGILAALLCLGFACQYDPHAHRATSHAPDRKDVVGVWMLKEQWVISGGLEPFAQYHCMLEIREDGTFIATNIHSPGIRSPSGREIFEQLASGSGTWRVDTIGSVDDGSGHTHPWFGVCFEGDKPSLKSAGFMNDRAPYELIQEVGDPDSGEALIFQRVI